MIWKLSSGMILLFFTLACQPAGQEYNLDGHWEIENAVVEGKETSRLSNLFFIFEGSLLTTNILGETDDFPFHIHKNSIVQESQPSLEYEISDYSDSTLVLVTKIRDASFVLSLQKATMSSENSTE